MWKGEQPTRVDRATANGNGVMTASDGRSGNVIANVTERKRGKGRESVIENGVTATEGTETVGIETAKDTESETGTAIEKETEMIGIGGKGEAALKAGGV